MIALIRRYIPPPARIWTVGTAVTTIDGRVSPYKGIRPGDILAFEAGSHSAKSIKNIYGTRSRPILIVNRGGQVEFNSADYSDGAMFMRNCQHLHISGTGSDGIDYGIKLTKYYSKGLYGTCKTNNIEIEHVEIMESVVTGIGVHFLTYGLPAAYVNSHNWDAYDYNYDGAADSLDEMDGRYWTLDGIKVHDCHFDGTEAVYNLDVPIYIGMSNYTENPFGRTLEDADGTPVADVPCWFPPSANMEVYNNIFEHTEMKCVQIGACLTRSLVHDNTFTDVCHQTSAHDPAIGINPGSSDVRIYNNRIINMNNGYGVYSYGEDVMIYNNLIINPGYYGMIVQDLKPVGYHHYKSTRVFHNTIVSSYNAECVGFANSEGEDDRVQNNILINTNAKYISGTLDASSNNYTSTDVDSAYFTDHDNNDFTLTENSPAIDTGADLSSYGIVDDISGVARPLFAGYDCGAYESLNEYVPTPPPVFIVDIDHEDGTLSEWTSTSGADLSVMGGAALGGSSYGMNVLIDDTTPDYGSKAVGDASGIWSIRYHFDPNTIPMDASEEIYLFATRNNSSEFTAVIGIIFTAGTYKIYIRLYNDAAGATTSSIYSLPGTADGEHCIEVLLQRASSNVASDGSLQLFVDETDLVTISGIDNYDRCSILGYVRLGNIAVVGTPGPGNIFLDQLVINNTGAYIGPSV